jgi:hypothetical protein
VVLEVVGWQLERSGGMKYLNVRAGAPRSVRASERAGGIRLHTPRESQSRCLLRVSRAWRVRVLLVLLLLWGISGGSRVRLAPQWTSWMPRGDGRGRSRNDGQPLKEQARSRWNLQKHTRPSFYIQHSLSASMCFEQTFHVPVVVRT